MIDIEVARTFLAVIDAGTFFEASKRVYCSQSTVSTRIKTLEERLGRTVFERSKAGASLTPAGHHFERYARAMVRAWEQGRHQAGIPEEYDDLLVIGGQYSLWGQLLTQWLMRMRERMPRIAFRAESGTATTMGQLLSEGLVDMAVVHQPRTGMDIEVQHLVDDELVMVTTDPDGGYIDRYMFVDWGEEFQTAHAQKLPEHMLTRTTLSLGLIAPQMLIATQAAGYMPRRLVAPHIDEGYLFIAKDTPKFPYPIYLAYQANSGKETYKKAISILKRTTRDYMSGDLDGPFWADEEEEEDED